MIYMYYTDIVRRHNNASLWITDTCPGNMIMIFLKQNVNMKMDTWACYVENPSDWYLLLCIYCSFLPEMTLYTNANISRRVRCYAFIF